MNEAQTRKALIDPALRAAGWDTSPARWEPEFPVSLGRIGSDAKHHNPKFADYVLFFGKKRIAVVEAKRAMRDFDAGEAQARIGRSTSRSSRRCLARTATILYVVSRNLSSFTFPCEARAAGIAP